jgi:peptidoglycan-N-acetylglucosamine deacetylase
MHQIIHPLKYSHSPPYLLKALTRKRITWEYPSGEKKLYLTFDDGPHPEVTPAVLQALDAFRAKGTFFLSGRQAESHPELVQQIISGGHQLGNHTYSHPDGWRTPMKEYLADVMRCRQVVASQLFRPPYGRLLPAQLQQLRKEGFHTVMWSVLTGDFDTAALPATLLEKTLRHTRDGGILVLHDSPKAAGHCLFLLPRILEHYSGRGFTFDVIR